ncbi:hypothetical protein [Crateriforma conspicua]|uniref:hypothetical protein n=1 Tax=Crateriforma conspicua TaxID=2527996 RepID=UPI0011A62645|nr:hypothetical protein [Crateriforma conspicua]
MTAWQIHPSKRSPTKTASNAAEPASASGDGHSAAQHSLREQIEADKYLRSVKAAEGRNSLKQKIGLGRFVPPGAFG